MKQIYFENKDLNLIAFCARRYAINHNLSIEEDEIIDKFYDFVFHSKQSFTIEENNY